MKPQRLLYTLLLGRRHANRRFFLVRNRADENTIPIDLLKRFFKIGIAGAFYNLKEFTSFIQTSDFSAQF